MRPSNERHPGSERGLQRVCAPLRYVSSGAQIIAKRSKLRQRIRVPGSSLSIICCAGISRVGCRKLAYSQGSFMSRQPKKVPMSTRDCGVPKCKEKKQSLDRWWPAVHQSCAQIQRFPLPFFRHWASERSGAVPRTPALPGYCRGIAGT